MIKLLITIFILLFVLFVKSSFRIIKKEIKEPIFLSKEQTRNYLKNDRDNFVKSLDKINLIARKSKNYKEYITKISKSSLDFSKEEKDKILKGYLDAFRKLLDCSDEFLNKYGFERENLLKLLENVRIQIALTKNKEYEYGMPHTRENIIFLTTYYLKNNINNSLKLSRTFIHEIIHLYQRYFRKYYNKFLKRNRWSIENIKKYSRKRINPDLDNNVWKREHTIYISEFSSDTPESLEDVKNISSNDEHPYEYYAYKISNLLIL